MRKVIINLEFETEPTRDDVMGKLLDVIEDNSLEYTLEPSDLDLAFNRAFSKPLSNREDDSK